MQNLAFSSPLVCCAWLLLAAATAVAQAPVETDPAALAAPGPEAKEPYTFSGDAEVVASRLAGDAVAAGRREVVLSRAEIEALPVSSVQDLLAVLPGVGLARRGARGVQGDLNLRGSTFEQVLVLLNGVRISNPQTGHHHLDLFIPLAAIERVEVLYGPSSAVHGPDAFGGAINIVTGTPSTSAFARVGENDLAGGGVAGGFGPGLWAAAEREVHTGFRDNTEADVNQAAGGWSWTGGEAAVDLVVAAGRRDFGAYRFYSQAYPDERESTSGQLLTLTGAAPAGGLELGFGLRLDHHRDDFILDRERPDWFRNRHDTRGGLVDLSVAGELGELVWVAGVEAAREQIDSSNLGRHHRSREAGFFELGRLAGPLTWGLQLRLDHQDTWGWVDTAALGGSWQPAEGWRLRAHWGQSFRAPSFTDLYYDSPSTVGNPELEPEEGQTVEVGVQRGPLSLALFERRADTIIDYLLDDDGVWRAANLGRVQTRGAELAAVFPAWGKLSWQRLGVSWLHSELDVDPESSRYALSHPRIEAAWTGAAVLNHRWQAGWAVRWQDPAAGGSWWTVDLELRYRLYHGLWLAAEGANILDREITEVRGVPLPGRWLSLSLSYCDPR